MGSADSKSDRSHQEAVQSDMDAVTSRFEDSE